jgi:hypothetical protein
MHIESQPQGASGDDRSSRFARLEQHEWPLPSWHNAGTALGNIRSYEANLAYQLRSAYTELERDFRSVFGYFSPDAFTDAPTAEQIVEILDSARAALERADSDLRVIASELGLAERFMVWLLPPNLALPRATSIYFQLQELTDPKAKRLAARLRDCLAGLSEAQLWEDPRIFGGLRGLMDECLSYLGHAALEERVGTGLQLERLKDLRNWGVLVLVALVVVAPVIENEASQKLWNAPFLEELPMLLMALVTTLGVAVTGAVAGFLSGLLQARESRVGLADYQESMLKLQLRPLVGATVAVVLYVLLTWGILPGISIENAGSYVLIAFASGFSERYFLRLLRVDDAAEDRSEQSPSGTTVETTPGPGSLQGPAAQPGGSPD